jgi:hypothetical protein
MKELIWGQSTISRYGCSAEGPYRGTLPLPYSADLHGHYETSIKDEFVVLEEKLGRRQINPLTPELTLILLTWIIG